MIRMEQRKHRSVKGRVGKVMSIKAMKSVRGRARVSKREQESRMVRL
jgi:hypothetical protein